MAVARYTFAVNRRYKRDGEQEADFGWVYYIKSVNAQKIVMGLETKRTGKHGRYYQDVRVR